MDPLITLGAKGAGSIIGKPAFSLITKPFIRFRLAWAVSKAAKKENISVPWRKLSSVLKNSDFREAIAAGDPQSMEKLTALLTSEILANRSNDKSALSRVLELIQNQTLRLISEKESRVAQTERLENVIERNHRELLTTPRDDINFYEALNKLHPWRVDSAKDIATQYSGFRSLVITLTNENDRNALLNQWKASPPILLSDAPAEAWFWLAYVSVDYNAIESALHFISKGIEAGGPSSYWYAYAGVVIGTDTPEHSTRACEYWARSVPKHPIAEAGEAITQGDFKRAESVLNTWRPENPHDESLKILLQIASINGQEDYNRSINLGLEASISHPDGSVNLLSTAEALLARGYHDFSEHPLNDFTQAFNLAIQARDSVRSWSGNSVTPILVAVKASALATNLEQAWQLTQETPSGSALRHESQNALIRGEAALLAAMMGRFEQSQIIADALENPFISLTVEGWKAINDDRIKDAEKAWLQAWDCAPDEISKLQTASALADLGGKLPNLDSLPIEYKNSVDQILTRHEVMSSEDPMALLRVRAKSEKHLTFLYAERLASQGQIDKAAIVLESGGNRWNHPEMMQMAASHYQSTGKQAKAYEVASLSLSFGGTNWAGRLHSLMIQANALEAKGDFKQSLAIAREIVSVSPENSTNRWALVHMLNRIGNTEDAWRTLTPEGQPIAPLSLTDAFVWINLVAKYDNSPEFIQRCLDTLQSWQHEEDLVGVFLTQIYAGLNLHETEVSDSDLNELHKATQQFSDAHPNNQVFRKITVNENDPFDSLTELLKEHFTFSPEIMELQRKIIDGEVPLGFASELGSRTYTDLCITGVGVTYSHLPALAITGQNAATTALNSRVAIDISSVATLTLLDSAMIDKLSASFFSLESTDTAFRDALAAQQIMNLNSTMTLGWDAEKNQPALYEIKEDEAKVLSQRTNQAVDLIAGYEKHSWPELLHKDFSRRGTWLNALDFALSEKIAFWCDDRSLRQIAFSKGVPTFGTIDLLTALGTSGLIDQDLDRSIRAKLILGFHVGMEFDFDVFNLAAESEQWRAQGTAVALSRAESWINPVECINFAKYAMAQNASKDLNGLTNWVTATALGLIRITHGDTEKASKNLTLLLTHLFTQTWLRPDTLPSVIKGFRIALREFPNITDPLPKVLAVVHAQISEKHGMPSATEFLLMLIRNLDDEDRITATRVMLVGEDAP